ncbi:MAG: Zn-dependent exopeptidase M28, partial [Parcubacteria group bacterium]|nr:Zn-dependent exopeptidase M28 [Parcubacteria group bacterium]
SYGYQVRFQPFTFNASPNRKVLATTDRNVIASKTGRDTTKVLVVGAHYDSVENSPGADDNASGTAVLLEVARILASRTPDIAVELVAFGAEEDGLIGSLAYVLHNKGRRIVGMVNIDMAGVGEFIWIANDQGPNYLTALALDAAKKLGIAATQERSASSDHVSFETMGIPVVFFNRPENDNIHSPKDAFDKVVPRFVRDMAQIALAVVEWHYQKQ